jgi:hypothetical protein
MGGNNPNEIRGLQVASWTIQLANPGGRFNF